MTARLFALLCAVAPLAAVAQTVPASTDLVWGSEPAGHLLEIRDGAVHLDGVVLPDAAPAGLDLAGLTLALDYSGPVTPVVEVDGQAYVLEGGRLVRFEVKYKRRGPSNRQLAALQETFATCGKIYASCDELGGSLGATGKEFDEVKAKAEAVGAKAKRFLDTDWRATFDVSPAPVQ